MSNAAGLLARGSWDPSQVACSWIETTYDPGPAAHALADKALAELKARSSPSHDGLATRLAGFSFSDHTLELELQPVRWSMRLLEDALGSLSALCVTRDAEGRWLAGRRAAWVASWAGRWALGAAGAVEVGENPAQTMERELEEEWSLKADRITVEALVSLPNRLAMVVGMAWLPEAAPDPVLDSEHDEFDWWPADISAWPAEADEPLRRIATVLTKQ